MNNNDMEDDQADRLFLEYDEKNRNQNKSSNKQTDKSRKKIPDAKMSSNKNTEEMEAETRKVNKLKFQDLPEQIEMYLIEVYSFGSKLFLTGIMDNGQTLNIVAGDLYREIYFVLKNEGQNENEMSEKYLNRAEQQIRMKLKNAGLADDQYIGHMVDMQYVFELKQVPRNRRKYFKVRYSFKIQLEEQIQPDCEGETFKYVIGTTYTALQLLIINRRIKGPCWIKIDKQYLSENTHNNVEVGLCADINFLQSIQVTDRTEPPTVRVMSISIKSIVPATISKKKYFPNNKDDTHIYAISYHFCPEYRVSIKDPKPKLIHRTFYLEQLGNLPSDQFTSCSEENVLFARFYADILKYDPDFFVCHDASAILDTLVCRLAKLDKNSKIKLSRLKVARDASKSNQTQRINSFIAGRLLVDTYFHSKDMVKSIQYDLENMAQYARPQKKFTGISDEESKTFFNEDKPLALVNKCREQSELTFQIMNHFQILQMTRQLSNICGNLWKRSLENKRAERNEFLIMHECKSRDLIIPDKFIKNKGGDDEEVEAKKKYQGGMVLQPEKGFYSQYILLLDFNSLYPSIIRQYNVCFSIIDRPKLTLDFYYKSKTKKKQQKQKRQKKQATAMDEQNPEDDGLQQMFQNTKSCNNKSQWGFLPILINDIVEQRKKCKRKMKNASNIQSLILDIQQKCYKVVANSIYGCLGFSVSRFYSRPLAALITKKGRDSLLSARDIVNKKGGVRVIYGDTDSLMIEPSNLGADQTMTEVQKLKSLKKVADQLRAEINGKYTFLQIDVDGIFKPLILLMKKKYVANKLKNFQDILIGVATQPKFTLEYKGIEIVRRDGCKLARDTLQKVINIMVRSDNSELDTRYEQIIDLFTKLNNDIMKQPLQNLLFSKQLTKKPKDYANADHLPHVKVAKDRIEAGQKDQSLVNHTIFYLICKPRDTNTALARNAFDLKTFKRSQQFEPNNKLEIDYDYYKSIVVEPVGRLLAPINDQIYDRIVKILDISKHRVKNLREIIDDEAFQAEKIGEAIGNNLKSKARQFARELGANLKCLNVKCQLQFPIIDSDSTAMINVRCPGKDCGYSMVNVVSNKIRSKMREQQANYYNNRKRCKCTKTYQLTNIIPCCDLDKKSSHQKNQISFKLHNFLYLVEDLCSLTISRLDSRVYDMERKKLIKVNQMVQSFLNQSNYEQIVQAMSKINL